MKLAVAIAVLGAIGSLCRFTLGSAIQRHVGLAFPAGTLVINVLGCLGIGFVMGFFAARGAESSPTRVALTAGFMGGFTTYSSFAFETWVLVERRAWLAAAANVGLTLVVCFVACVGGVAVGRAVGASR